jgi:hypothetical protein
MADNQHPLRVFIFDSTRRRSHLFFRYLSTHNAFKPIYHPFICAAMFGPENGGQHLRRAVYKNLGEELGHVPGDDATFASDMQQFVTNIAETERKGKVVLANEHWFNVLKLEHWTGLLRDPDYQDSSLGTNPTHIPDDFFATLTPIVLIRHPALAVDSIYRTKVALGRPSLEEEHFELLCNDRALRVLYTYFSSRGQEPIVVDAEDLLWRTNDLAKGICQRLGIDANGLSETWSPTPQSEIEKMNPIIYMFTKDMHDSDGICRPAVKVSYSLSVA